MMTAVFRAGCVWRAVMHGDVALALLPLLRVGLAALLTFVLGTGTSGHVLHSASPPC
ncbi:MAG TPA: hypothetical protein VKF37_19815 [Chloroflexota bacterium]|nr:hypothetical protein [Chloroflexota bacterium]